MIHLVGVVAVCVVASPVVVFAAAFLAALADFIYASAFPVEVPVYQDEMY